MSYDLFFYRDKEQPAITGTAFQKYFRARADYQVKDSQVWYENEDTGVYFSFDYGEREEEEVSFNMNYNRPHIFGLEAELDVSAFVQFFRVLVDDPQDAGMGQGAYTSQGFLERRQPIWLPNNDI